MKIYLVRHGATEGNLLKKYIGRTQESLCQKGICDLKETAGRWQGLGIERCYVSPSLRCIQTAQILFPGLRHFPIEELQECDFGEFEGKSYRELSGNAAYQAWIDSGGTLPFPGGESREEFRRRSLIGFYKVLEDVYKGEQKGTSQVIQDVQEKSLVIVAHGGTFMNLLETLALEERSFYDWHLENGQGLEIALTRQEAHLLLRERPLKRYPVLWVEKNEPCLRRL